MINFQEAVIQASNDKPVVVDFWASWCGPCKVLGPIIEQIAAEQSNQWTLVKVNTEEMPDIAQQYQIRSIPNVKMFVKGQVVAEFSGALPRNSILQWLDENLPDERKNELTQLIKQADTAAGLENLRTFVAANEDLLEGRIALAQKLIYTDPDGAYDLIADIKLGHPSFGDVEPIYTLHHFFTEAFIDAPIGDKMAAAREALQEQKMETAIQTIIEAVTIDKTYADDLPRKVAIALFNLLGPKHELVKNYRWRFDMALY